jgi:hypothetical protein
MRKITDKIVGAFNNREKKSSGNTVSTGDALFLHGNKIAEWRGTELWITNAGWFSNTTKERVNDIFGVSICQKDYTWFLNGQSWDGEWTKVALAS